MHWTLGILRLRQAVFYDLAFSGWTASPSRPPQVSHIVSYLALIPLQKHAVRFAKLRLGANGVLFQHKFSFLYCPSHRMIFPAMRDEPFLRVDAFFPRFRFHAHVGTIGQEFARFDIVREINFQNIIADVLDQARVLNGE